MVLVPRMDSLSAIPKQPEELVLAALGFPQNALLLRILFLTYENGATWT